MFGNWLLKRCLGTYTCELYMPHVLLIARWEVIHSFYVMSPYSHGKYVLSSFHQVFTLSSPVWDITSQFSKSVLLSQTDMPHDGKQYSQSISINMQHKIKVHSQVYSKILPSGCEREWKLPVVWSLLYGALRRTLVRSDLARR